MNINLQKAVALAKKSLSENNISNAILEKVLINSIREYQQKINVGIQDSTTDLLQIFKSDVKTQIFNVVDSWEPYNKEACLFPQNCRFFFSKGPFDIAVIEERPQIRSIQLNRIVAESRRYGLHMPYCIFAFLFKNNNFQEAYMGWRKHPLQSLDDELYEPLLPNIHEDLAICYGHIKPQQATINEKINYLIEYFWLSEFNSDLFKNKSVSFLDWEKNSDYINDKDLKPVITLSKMIDTMCFFSQDIKLQHKLSENIDKVSEALFKKIMSFFQQKKFEKFYPKEITDHLNDAVDYVIEEYDLVLKAIDLELSSLIKTNEIGWEQGGKFWTNE